MKRIKDALPHSDLRQQRTRKFLTDALRALMEERPFSQISVVDICKRAMVHRTTFYAHFDDKQALLRYTVSEMIQREFEAADAAQARPAGPKEYFLAIFQNVLRFMREHKELYQAGAAGCGEVELFTLESTVAEELCRKFSQPDMFPYGPDFNPALTAHFYAGAILSLIRWWLDQDAAVPDEVVLGHLEYFIPLPQAEKG